MAGWAGGSNGRTATAARPPVDGGNGVSDTWPPAQARHGRPAPGPEALAGTPGRAAAPGPGVGTEPVPARRRGHVLGTVRGKLVASFSVLAVLVVATALAGVAVAGTARSGALAARRNLQVTRAVKQLQLDATAVAVAENSVAFDYASHADPSGDLASFSSSAAAFTADAAQARRLGLDRAEQADLAKAVAAFNHYRDLSTQINHDDAIGTKASLAAAAPKVAALSFSTITKPLEALVSRVAKSIDASTSASLSSAGTDQGLLLGLGAFVLLLALGSALVIVRAVARPIDTLSTTLRAVAGGDLSARAEVATGDELGRLADHLNTAIAAQEEARREIDRQTADQTAMSSANAGVLDVLGALRSARSVDEAVRVGLETICARLGWGYGSYYALEPGGRALSFRAEAGPLAGGELSGRSRGGTIAAGADLDGRAAASRAIVTSGNLEELADSPRARAARALGSASAAAFPVVVGDTVVGTMSFFAAPGGPALSTWREKALGDAGHVVSSAVERIADQVREREGEAELREKVDQILDVVSSAATGDLTVEVPFAGDDAIGRVGTSLAGFLADLRERMRAIGENTSGLAAAIEELSGRNLEGGSAVGARAGTVETVAAAAEELTSSIQEIASAAADAARVALEGASAAESTSATVVHLSDSSAEIGQVIKTITSIAEQTNMLALNATIEAARAGEAGKGFAVVASEVKDLAQGTTAAADDVAERIQAIQVDAERTVTAVTAIKEVVDRINALQGSIASAVEEQTATTNEIARSMSGAAEAAGDIGRMTLELEGLIARFSC